MVRRKSVDKSDLRVFVEAYVKTALWSTMDAETSQFLDEMGFDACDISLAAMKQSRAECEFFITTYGAFFDDDRYLAICRAGSPFCQAAHDFWLTRNGHDPGFGDGDWLEPAAKILTDASKRMGALDIEIGDDDRLYFLSAGGCERGPLHRPKKKSRTQVKPTPSPAQ